MRAARAYARLEQPELGAALELSLSTIRRMEGARREITTDELLEIARICKVPVEFMLDDFAVIEQVREQRELLLGIRDEIVDEVRKVAERGGKRKRNAA